MFYPNAYNYYPEQNSLNFTKVYGNHDDDMEYRYNEGKILFTLKQITELGEEDKVLPLASL